MKSKFTPGPYRYDSDCTIRQNVTGYPITDVVYGKTVAQQKANGELLACAPDMLEVLKLALGAIAIECSATRERVLEVIAKAEGRE